MYGYLKYDYKGKKTPAKNVYKCYYCGLCCSLKKNYGWFSTIFLSNDVVFLNMILSYGSQRVKYLKPQCCFWKRCSKISLEYHSPYWKRVAAFTLALVYAKAYDDILDKKSVFSRMRYGLVKAITKRARKENAAMFEHTKDSMISLNKIENFGIDVAAQGNYFSSAILHGITTYVTEDLSTTTLSLVSSILKWLCFIDAVDDYEKDVKEKTYNPFNWIAGMSKKAIPAKWIDFFSKNWYEVLSIYSDIYTQLQNSMHDIQNSNAIEAEVIRHVIYNNMPQKLANAMKGSRK